MRTMTKALVVGVLGLAANAWAADRLADGFARPGDEARPWTWWHWVSGYASKEGITKDLEAMKRIGLGGAQVFAVDQGPRAPKPVMYMSPEWRELMTFAMSEANRLGLTMTMHGCEGWNESGGPWVKVENSMQKVVWTETQAKGGGKVEVSLRRPETVNDFYREIAVLAYPAVEGDGVSVIKLKPTFTASGGADLAKLADGGMAKPVVIKPAKKGGPAWVELTFEKPERIGSVRAWPISASTKTEVRVSADGKEWRIVGSFSTGSKAKAKVMHAVTFDAADVKAIRLQVNKPDAGGWELAEVEVGGATVPDFLARSGMESKVEMAPLPASVSRRMVIPRDKIVDLTSKMSDDGKLVWDDAPAGDWTILRVGATTTGKTNSPAMPETRGLEVDKMNRKAVQDHFKNSAGVVIGDSEGSAGALKWILLDSWEAGCQNWTLLMREEFQGLRGYDPLPWLPALTGRYVGSPELTERFLWDYRRTIADLIAENHFGLYQDLCHQNGLKLTGEAVGIGMPTIADQLQCKGRTDLPMGEFWVDRAPRDGDPKEAASASHIYGQNVASAESFTAQPQAAQWRNDPFSLKALGDRMFCLGINKFVFHRYAHQPDDRAPGVTMGPWGINFERTNTWWDQGRAWIDYLTRCEYLLQRGRFVADVCYYYGEGAPNTVRIESLDPKPVKGHDYDVCNREVLLTKMKVEDGQIVLHSGMRYRVLVLPNDDRMTPEVAAKVGELVKTGATVIGPRPVASPSLNSYPSCDAIVKAMAGEIWGDCDGKAVKEHQWGKGRVIWGRSLEEVLGVAKDFETPTGGIEYIHRTDSDADIYFVSNQKNAGQVAECTFRVSGKAPEFWWPDTGKTERAPIWSAKDGRVVVPVPLEPAGSVFVVFREKGTPAITGVTRDGKSIFAVEEEKAPAGALEIRKAEYAGIDAGSGSKDVTKAVAAAVKDGTMAIIPTNQQFGGDPARNVPKQLRVDYTFNGQAGSIAVSEGQELRLPPAGDPTPLPRLAEVHTGTDGKPQLVVWKSGAYRVETPGSTESFVTANVKDAATLALVGPWQVKFEEGRGAPAALTFDKLVSWPDHPDEGVKYFSGTATYGSDIDVPGEMVNQKARLSLDLGVVKNLAEVSVNGRSFGVLWKPPFRADVTRAIKPGKNHVEIKVTNLWPNRLIGDLNLPEEQRVTWTTYNPYKKDSPLLKSGLLGPVKIEAGVVIDLK